jgi:hypothetical protein
VESQRGGTASQDARREADDPPNKSTVCHKERREKGLGPWNWLGCVRIPFEGGNASSRPECAGVKRLNGADVGFDPGNIARLGVDVPAGTQATREVRVID